MCSKDWKEDNYLEAQTWTEFEEDCDAVNQARASKSMTVDTVPTSVSSLETLHRWRMPFGMRRERPRGRWQATSKRTDTRTVDDCETPCPPCKPGLGPQTPLGASLAPCSKTLPKRITCWTAPLVLVTCSECSQDTNKCFCGTQVLSLATRWPHFGLPTRDSEVK